MSSRHLALAERHLIEARIRIDQQERIVSIASADRDLAEDLLSVLCAIERQMVRHRDRLLRSAVTSRRRTIAASGAASASRRFAP